MFVVGIVLPVPVWELDPLLLVGKGYQCAIVSTQQSFEWHISFISPPLTFI